MKKTPALPTTRLTVTVIQNDAGRDPAHNLLRLQRLLARAPASDLIALPEVFALRGGDADYRAAAESIPGPLTERFAAIARKSHSWLLAGSLIEKAGRRIFNTSVLLDRRGRIRAAYRKMHLFEAFLDTGEVVRETDLYAAGNTPVMADIEDWRFGLCLCYDLRFPELFRFYSARGAHAFLAPSNFTQQTGRAHWETLLRARAIENQCFVIAPGQCGANPVTRIVSHGHSMVVGPWGEILRQLKDDESLFTVKLDPQALSATRRRIPVLQHRRL